MNPRAVFVPRGRKRQDYSIFRRTIRSESALTIEPV